MQSRLGRVLAFKRTMAEEAAPEARLYHYRATVTDVYDGDTVTVDLDLGFHVWVRGENIRLANIGAPELNSQTAAAGKASGDFLRDLVLNKSVIVETIKAPKGGDKQKKYGLYLGVIWLGSTNVNKLLVSKGYAIHSEY
jgi:endonuclease YncB( thermonuclease family)